MGGLAAWKHSTDTILFVHNVQTDGGIGMLFGIEAFSTTMRLYYVLSFLP